MLLWSRIFLVINVGVLIIMPSYESISLGGDKSALVVEIGSAFTKYDSKDKLKTI